MRRASDSVPGFGKVLRSRKYQGWLWGYLLILPTVLGLGLFYLWPLVQSFYLAFTRWGAFGDYRWCGLQNFERLVSDPKIVDALRNSLIFTGLTVPLSISLATLIAVLLNAKIRGVSFYRVLYFLPVVTMPAAVGIVWRWLFNADYGAINYVLQKVFGIRGPSWLTDPKIALYSLVAVAVWGAIGNNMIIILSGLQNIPTVYYEAADIDGAGVLTKFFRITLPMLSPTLFFVSVTAIIGALQMFELVYMMIGINSPAIRATQTVVYLFYREAFINMNKGYASAIILVLFVIILGLTFIQLRLQRRWVHYD
jgi:multiple sugar transport system permease protein